MPSYDQVALSAAVRNSLLSLQDTSDLIERTEKRLSTGLRVASAVDDPVAFFQAKSLSDRAFDFQERKDGIDQGISTITAALNAVEGIERLTQQMKGLSQSMKSANDTQFSELVRQFNEIRVQIDRIAADSTYQGVNLVNGTGQKLDVEFSEKTNSFLTVESVDLRHTGLGISEVTTAVVFTGDTVFDVILASAAGIVLANQTNDQGVSQITATFSFTYNGPDDDLTAGTAMQITYGDTFLTLDIQNETSITQNAVLNLGIVSSAADVIATHGTESTSIFVVVASAHSLAGQTADLMVTYFGAVDEAASQTLVAPDGMTAVQEGDTDAINLVIDELDSALTTLRGNAATLGSNVALLQTRLRFTTDYVNTLEAGAGKLTLADINEEGANLLALQTRQQLGISALAFAGQAEQSILALFN
ncbi:MAG: flagellin N-terminal helical domain-containing protein [Rhodospirillales bacterium]